jgi:hypothetical protein
MELTRSLGHTEIEGVNYDVFANGHAEYAADTKILTITLVCYLLPDNVARLDERMVPAWLPPKQVDREHVDADEASDLAKDVFHRWCSKVTHAVPHLRT